MKLSRLRELVEDQYLQNVPARDDWADWLYTDHVLWVGEKTEQLCNRFKGNKEVAVAAALLHDIADSVMQRENPEHEQISLDIARRVCKKAGYSEEQIRIIVDDICLKHSCHNGVVPQSHEGKIVATADACAHFETEFYLYAFNHGSSFGDYAWMKQWMSKKLDRDFRDKIFFDEVRREIEPIYHSLKKICS